MISKSIGTMGETGAANLTAGRKWKWNLSRSLGLDTQVKAIVQYKKGWTLYCPQLTAKLGHGALGPPALSLAVEDPKRGRGAAEFEFFDNSCDFSAEGKYRTPKITAHNVSHQETPFLWQRGSPAIMRIAQREVRLIETIWAISFNMYYLFGSPNLSLNLVNH